MTKGRGEPGRGPGSGDPLATAPLEQLRVLFDTVAEGVIIADSARKVLAVNRVVEELWGYSARQLLGKELQFLMSMEAREGLQSAWADAERGVAAKRLTLEAFRRDGSSFPVEIGIARARIGDSPRYTVAVRDLSLLRRTGQRLRELEKALETLPVGATISDLDRRLTYVNPAVARMHGFHPEELVGRDIRTLVPQELWERMDLVSLIASGPWCRESEGRRQGEPFPVEVMPEIVTDHRGDPAAVVTIFQDVTRRRQAEAALRESEERYALAVQGANDGIWDWDLRRREIYFSDRWTAMLGLAADELGSTPEDWLSRVHPDDRARLEEAIHDHLEGRSRHLEAENRVLHADGSYRWILTRGLAVREESGEPVRLAGSHTDITERKVNDPLTGLPNRALLADRLTRARERARRQATRTRPGLLILDLDRFKVVNDSLGHGVGDQLLTAFAERLARCAGPGDTVARLGGDEFAVLLEECRDTAQAVGVADAILRELATPFQVADQEIFASVSIGIRVGSPGDDRPEDLLREADTAMYRAKALGRARYQLYDPEMRRRAVTQLRLETDLRRALERHELVVHYQPIVSLADDVINGFEALVRWNHPEHGTLQPAEFIPLAEETGQIIPIGMWVLEEACGQIRRWQEEFQFEPPLSVSVNLSAKQFAQTDLLKQVQAALVRTDLAPERLKLEVTESAVVDRPDVAVEVLGALRELGVQVCIDDFGTGYSSLSYLHRYPVDTLKIDRSFVSSMGLEAKKADLVRTIVRMARDLGMSVIAEGVETTEQLRNLRNLPCEYMQGFCFSRPLDPETASQLLARRRVTPSRFTEILSGNWEG